MFKQGDIVTHKLLPDRLMIVTYTRHADRKDAWLECRWFGSDGHAYLEDFAECELVLYSDESNPFQHQKLWRCEL